MSHKGQTGKSEQTGKNAHDACHMSLAGTRQTTSDAQRGATHVANQHKDVGSLVQILIPMSMTRWDVSPVLAVSTVLKTVIPVLVTKTATVVSKLALVWRD